MDSKLYLRTRTVPRRARSRRLREAGLTRLDVKRAVRQSDAGLSSLWSRSENDRRQYLELQNAFDRSQLTLSQINTDLKVINQTTQHITGRLDSYTIMTDAEVAGMCANLWQ